MTPDLANHHHAITPGRTAALPGDSSWARGTPCRRHDLPANGAI